MARSKEILDGLFLMCRCSLRLYASRIAGASPHSILILASCALTSGEGSVASPPPAVPPFFPPTPGTLAGSLDRFTAPRSTSEKYKLKTQIYLSQQWRMTAETRGSMLAGKSNRRSMNPTTPITFTKRRSGKLTTSFSPQIPYLVTNCKQRCTDLEGAEVAPRDGPRHKLPQDNSEAEHVRSDDSIPFLVSRGIGGGEAASCSKRVQWNESRGAI